LAFIAKVGPDGEAEVGLGVLARLGGDRLGGEQGGAAHSAGNHRDAGRLGRPLDQAGPLHGDSLVVVAASDTWRLESEGTTSGSELPPTARSDTVSPVWPAPPRRSSGTRPERNGTRRRERARVAVATPSELTSVPGREAAETAATTSGRTAPTGCSGGARPR